MRRATRPEHRVLRVHAVGEEERQVGREVVDVHAAREVVLDEGEAVGQREGELGDRVRPGLGDVVAGDRHRVEVADLVVDEVLLDVAHQLEANSVEKMQVFCAWSSLRMSACTVPRTARERPRADLRRLVLGRLALVVGAELLELLVDRGVQEHGEQHRRRAVDGHRHRGRRVAQVEARVEHLHVVERGDRDARVADLAVDVRPVVRVLAVERHRVEGGGQALRRHARRRAGGSAGWCGPGRPRRRTCASGPRSRA